MTEWVEDTPLGPHNKTVAAINHYHYFDCWLCLIFILKWYKLLLYQNCPTPIQMMLTSFLMFFYPFLCHHHWSLYGCWLGIKLWEYLLKCRRHCFRERGETGDIRCERTEAQPCVWYLRKNKQYCNTTTSKMWPDQVMLNYDTGWVEGGATAHWELGTVQTTRLFSRNRYIIIVIILVQVGI